MYYLILMFLALGLAVTNGQRVAPGVPPQHYQQTPPQYQHPQQQQYQQHPQQNVAPGVNSQQYQQQQIHQQQQMQYQQVPVQQQPPVHQVPTQQVPVHQQVPVQQVHQDHAGGHHAPHGHQGQQVLNVGNVQNEREHIQEHMEVPIDTSKMSETELQFHYFKMHDSDNNNKLDGCELIKSLIHWHEQGSKDPQVGDKTFRDDELIALIDPILQTDDTSNDGYIDYPEFMRSQQKSQQNQQQAQKTEGEGAKEENKESPDAEEKIGGTYTDEKLTEVVNYVLSTMDTNKDGYIDYTEYRNNYNDDSSSKDNKP